MPRGVANENRSKSVKCITLPKKMERDFSNYWIYLQKMD